MTESGSVCLLKSPTKMPTHPTPQGIATEGSLARAHRPKGRWAGESHYADTREGGALGRPRNTSVRGGGSKVRIVKWVFKLQPLWLSINQFKSWYINCRLNFYMQFGRDNKFEFAMIDWCYCFGVGRMGLGIDILVSPFWFEFTLGLDPIGNHFRKVGKYQAIYWNESFFRCQVRAVI